METGRVGKRGRLPAGNWSRSVADPRHRSRRPPSTRLRLGDAQELLLHVRTSGRDAVVPFWMEGIALYVECRHLLVGDLDALGIGVGIEFAADFETGFRRGVCDQFDGHEEADERHGAPVL